MAQTAPQGARARAGNFKRPRAPALDGRLGRHEGRGDARERARFGHTGRRQGQKVLDRLFKRVPRLYSVVKLREALVQERDTLRDALFSVDAELLGYLEGYPLHVNRRVERLGHFFIQLHVQLNRAEHARSSRQNSVEDTDHGLFYKLSEGYGRQSVYGRYDEDRDVKPGREAVVVRELLGVVPVHIVALLLELAEVRLLFIVPRVLLHTLAREISAAMEGVPSGPRRTRPQPRPRRTGSSRGNPTRAP